MFFRGRVLKKSATANTSLQLPPPIIRNLPSQVLLLRVHFLGFLGVSFKEKCPSTHTSSIVATHHPKKTLNFCISQKKARVDFRVWCIRSQESLCECCVVLTPPRFMVISRIDNIKYDTDQQRDGIVKSSSNS